MKYNRFLPLIVPIIILLSHEIFFFWPTLIYIILVLDILLLFFTIRQFLIEAKAKDKVWSYLILPSILFISATLFSMMMPSQLLVQALFFTTAILIYYYLKAIYLYLVKTSYYQKYSLENISSYCNFLSYYFLASSIYGLQVFLSAPTWLLMIVLLTITAMIVYQVMWINKIDLRQGLLFLLIICLTLIEIAWATSFLTLSFYILGLILSVCYYILIGLSRFYLMGKLNKKLIKLYLIFGFSSLAIVLFTANWISHS